MKIEQKIFFVVISLAVVHLIHCFIAIGVVLSSALSVALTGSSFTGSKLGIVTLLYLILIVIGIFLGLNTLRQSANVVEEELTSLQKGKNKIFYIAVSSLITSLLYVLFVNVAVLY